MKIIQLMLMCILMCSQAFSQCVGLDIKVDKSSQCAPGIVQFVLTGSPAGSAYSWNFGSGYSSNSDTVYEFFLDPIVVDVSVKVTFPNGTTCTINRLGIAKILEKPIPTFSISRDILCDGPDSVVITNTTAKTKTISWIIDGTNYPVGTNRQTHYFKTVGEKDLSMVVTDTFGCRAVKIFKNIAIVYPDVIIDFTADNTSGCVTKNVQLTPKIDSKGETLTTYYWSFEGANKNGYNGYMPPSLIYRNAGEFSVSLRVSTENGCIHELIKPNYLKFGDSLQLKPTFSDTLICLKKSVTVKSGIDVDGDYKWTFGGNPKTKMIKKNEYILTYPAPGSFDVALQLTYNGCYSSVQIAKAVHVKNVVAKYESIDNYHCYTPHLTHLTNKSYSSDNSALQYQWTYFDVGGKKVGGSRNESDSFASPDWGRYDVQLVVTDPYGCKDTMLKKNYIRVFEIQPGFTSKERIACVDQEVTVLQNTPPSSYLSSDTFHWVLYDLDDTTILHEKSGPNFKYSFQKPGYYDVKMYAANGIGCRDSLKVDNYIEVIQPQIGFDISDSIICKNNTVVFNATTLPKHAPFKHAWFLTNSDGSQKYTLDFDTARRRTLKMDIPGEYDVHYYHRIEGGCYDTLSRPKSVNINGIMGTVTLDKTDGCNGMEINPKLKVLNNVHKGFTSDTIQYSWSVSPKYAENKMFNTNTANPRFELNRTGTYTITISAVNSAGCILTATSTSITVGVIADFKVDKQKVCAGSQVSLTNNSRLNPTGFQWKVVSVGQYDLESTKNPAVFTPLSNASYAIKLIANKNNECFDSVQRLVESIIVHSEFTLADTHLFCAPAYAQFYATSTNADSFYWDFGNGTKIATSDILIANIYERNSGNAKGFDVSLISKNNLGCADTLLVQEAVKVIGPVPNFKLQNFVGCEPLDVGFINEGHSFTSFLLNYKDGSPLDSISMQRHLYSITNSSNVQQFIPSIYVTDSLGCSAVFISGDTIIVSKSPVANAISGDLDGCLPKDITQTDNTPQVISKSWFLDGNIVQSGSKFAKNDFDAGAHELKLVVQNSAGCTDTVRKAFHLHTAPAIQIISAPYCLDQGAELKAIKESNHKIIQWIWSLNGPSKTDTTTTPELSTVFSEPGLHFVSVQAIDSNGCTSTANMNVEITSPADIPKGDIRYVSINESGEVEAAWNVELKHFLKFSSLMRSDGELLVQIPIVATNVQVIDQLNLLAPACYAIYHTNDCAVDGENSEPHCPIILDVKTGKPYELVLNWSHYKGWPGIEAYRIMRSYGDEDYEEIDQVPGNENTYIDKALCDISYTYYVEAIFEDRMSQSNRSSNEPIYIINEIALNVKNVTVDGQVIEVQWNPSTFDMVKSYNLYKWDATGTIPLAKWNINRNKYSYTDNEVSINSKSYLYTIETVDHCHKTNEVGLPGRSILLEGEYSNQVAHLNWNPYKQWYDGVEHYEIQLLTKNGFIHLADVPGNVTSYSDPEIHEVLDDYCYKIIAHSFTPEVKSVSNQVCIRGASITWVPNAFSPNEDDLNTVFRPSLMFVKLIQDGTYQTYEMEIFNRWGERLFHTNDAYEGWDGSYLSNGCQSGSYLYHIRVKGLDNVIYNHKGLVRLMR